MKKQGMVVEVNNGYEKIVREGRERIAIMNRYFDEVEECLKKYEEESFNDYHYTLYRQEYLRIVCNHQFKYTFIDRSNTAVADKIMAMKKVNKDFNLFSEKEIEQKCEDKIKEFAKDTAEKVYEFSKEKVVLFV